MPHSLYQDTTLISRGFSAPKGVERACPARLEAFGRVRSIVSVPRRALRGHAPRARWISPLRCISFSAPKGVERACPAKLSAAQRLYVDSFSAPKGVERACPSRHGPPCARRSASFSAPKGVERACPPFPGGDNGPPQSKVSVPRRALRGHAPPAVHGHPPRGCRGVSVPRRALRGHAPQDAPLDNA